MGIKLAKSDPIIVELDSIATELEKEGNVVLARMVDECSEELLNPPKSVSKEKTARKARTAKVKTSNKRVVRAAYGELKSITRDLIKEGDRKKRSRSS